MMLNAQKLNGYQDQLGLWQIGQTLHTMRSAVTWHLITP
jgi:hypothetical protein